MTRALTANNITRLERQEFVVETLLEISFPAQTSPARSARTFYYTTGNNPVSVSTPTSGGAKTFTHKSFVNNIGSIRESFTPQPITATITFDRIDLNSFDIFPSFMDNRVINGRVILYKLYRDNTTNLEDTTDGLIQYFNGKITAMDTTVSVTTRQFVLRCTSDFGDYSNTRGRNTSDIYGAGYGVELKWGDYFLK